MPYRREANRILSELGAGCIEAGDDLYGRQGKRQILVRFLPKALRVSSFNRRVAVASLREFDHLLCHSLCERILPVDLAKRAQHVLKYVTHDADVFGVERLMFENTVDWHAIFGTGPLRANGC